MLTDTDIDEQLNGAGADLRLQPSVRDDVMRRVRRESMQPTPRGGWRLVGRVAGLAACAAIVVALFGIPGRHVGGLGATEAFAAAIASVEKAHTFSARTTSRSVGDDGKERVLEIVIMFKQPNLERVEYGRGASMPEVMIRNYESRKSILLFPADKTAAMQDLSSMYSANAETGQTSLTQLETTPLDDVKKISATAVKEVGKEQLDGRDVRVLRSDDGKQPVRTVWADVKTGKPLKIEVSANGGKSTFTYSEIKLDEPLDDALFSLELPKGYAFQERFKEAAPPADPKVATLQKHSGKILAKLKTLMLHCIVYASNHDGQYPDTLEALATAKVVSPKALRTLLAPDDQPDGESMVEYRKPAAGNKSPSDVIVVYEKPAFRLPGYVGVGMADGHAELLTSEKFGKAVKE